MDWTPPPKPAETAEVRLIDAILDNRFPIGSNLPGERDLAALLGVTRPTLREAMQRLARDGWIEIRHGRPTRVRDYWHEGNLGVLGAIARRSEHLPPDFILNLLRVRELMAPTYTALAVRRAAPAVAELLASLCETEDTPEAFAAADWRLHHTLSKASGNPVFTLILNGFAALYQPMACRYFALPQARHHSRSYYAELLAAARAQDPGCAEAVTRRIMHDSIELWQAALT